MVSALDIELSHVTVSNLSHELDELVTEFKTSPLRTYYPYLYVDSLYLKVFNGLRFVSKAVMIALGVNEAPRPKGRGIFITPNLVVLGEA